jgi:hypothetical protein
MAVLAAIFSRSAGGRPVRRLLAAFCVLASVAAAQTPAPEPAPEYRVKAAFLFNFAQFVEWPASAFADEKAPLVIGVLGQDPFGPFLDGLVQGEKIGQHPIVVRRLPDDGNPAECHILFAGATAAGRLERMIVQLKGRGVLTVGDTDHFSRAGGMVRFVTEQGKIRLRINVSAAQDAGLVISSKLLRSATIVTPDKN